MSALNRIPRSPVLLIVCASVLVAGCAQPATDIDLGHVHGIAYDAATGDVFVASHHGLLRGQGEGKDRTWTFVGDRYDYMGFTQDATTAGTFYTSGHPDNAHAYGGVHLGLRRSTDGGVTWEQRSLKGEVDFHALTSIPSGTGWVAGYWKGQVKISTDAGLTWSDKPGPPSAVYALAASPGTLWAGTQAGVYRTSDLAGLQGWTRIAGPDSGIVTSLAVASDAQHLFASTGDGKAGAAYRSADAGLTWTKLAPASLAAAAAPVLFAFDAQDANYAVAAEASGRVWETNDAGLTWSELRDA